MSASPSQEQIEARFPCSETNKASLAREEPHKETTTASNFFQWSLYIVVISAKKHIRISGADYFIFIKSEDGLRIFHNRMLQLPKSSIQSKIFSRFGVP